MQRTSRATSEFLDTHVVNVRVESANFLALDRRSESYVALVCSAYEAMNAIAKRLDHKKPAVQLVALGLMGTCMKNCSLDFHRAAATPEVMKIMTSLANGKKNKGGCSLEE